MARTSTRLAVLLVALLALASTLVLGRLAWVHERTWDWTLSPVAAPQRIQLDDRNFRRTTEQPPPQPAAEVGRTLGGGTILSSAADSGLTPVVVWVRAGRHVWAYSLQGGP